ncbi:MAG: recombinase family protein [Candidatus Gastranaerophilales bacterium]|nr:recombinase family protein [Candidatus Gastranaerophilales bacterium]
MSNKDKKIIRCAIYTRKSSEEGLEQDFNSLDAQREACENYIKSQQHEGWIIVEKQYNDGGFSGGTLERPAIKELFKDIEAGKIDIVVVYKVDRLTRSLMDFSKIVELFDRQNASFVSITQHFNTTTSMGRLTLNILLSFAQFEREVTGERIRDKFAASKKKGMWMGGNVPIGYKCEERKLLLDSKHIKTVKTIFEKYLEFKTILKVKKYLDNSNIKSKAGNNFSKGNLYQILKNKIYIGLIHHKGNYYDGEHQGIIDKEVFEKVQRLIEQNRNNNKNCKYAKSASLLASKLFDDKNNRMMPSHSNKGKKRYRYYVSQTITQGKQNNLCSMDKIPAGEIEKFICSEIAYFLKQEENIQKYLNDISIIKQKEIFKKIKELKLSNIQIRSVLSRINLNKNNLKIFICEDGIERFLESLINSKESLKEASANSAKTISIQKDIKISRTARKGNALILNGEKNIKNVDTILINAIAKSYRWNKMLKTGKVKSIKEIAKLETEYCLDHIKKTIRLNILSPRIVESILKGTQAPELSLQKLYKLKTLNWKEQEQLLN